jgi:hypothetical protein
MIAMLTTVLEMLEKDGEQLNLQMDGYVCCCDAVVVGIIWTFTSQYLDASSVSSQSGVE